MTQECYIVYGAGRVGRKLVDLLLKMNQKVVVIWDRNSKKERNYRGILIQNPYEEHGVMQTSKDCRIIIGLANPLESKKIYQDFYGEGYKEIYLYQGGNIAEIFCSDSKKLEENCVLCACVETCEILMKKNIKSLYGISNLEKEKMLNSISIALTNRCVLNCQYCVQYTDEIKKSGIFYDMNLKSLKQYLSSILKEVYYIHELALTGGEVLLCRELPEILEYLYQLPQIGYIKLLTTATIEIADDLLEILQNPKLIVCVDVYGKEKIPAILYDNLDRNLEKLVENKVLYQVIDNRNGTWYDLGNMKKRKNSEENKKKNKECMFRMCLLLSVRGNLSWCCRNIFCLEYGLIPDDKRDYCNLADEKDVLRIKEILQLQYLHGCEYCNGTNEANIVPAGQQIEKTNI